MALVDGNLQLIAVDAGAEAILRGLTAASAAEGGLPQELLKILKERPRDAPADAYQSVTLVDGVYALRVFLVKGLAPGGASPMMALHLKRESSVKNAVELVSMEYHLTDREQEALIGMTMGLTSKELADRMQISPNTVKAFLRLIMIKMGVTTRAGIVGKLLGRDQQN